jgi:hypothetical protein
VFAARVHARRTRLPVIAGDDEELADVAGTPMSAVGARLDAER